MQYGYWYRVTLRGKWHIAASERLLHVTPACMELGGARRVMAATNDPLRNGGAVCQKCAAIAVRKIHADIAALHTAGITVGEP